MKRLTGFALLAAFFWVADARAQTLALEKGDHVSLIGNTLAERFQNDGWLETLIQARFPDHDLVFRNLAFSGDELDPKRRLRSENFGSPDQHLTLHKTDVVLAFFGFNESFAGRAGLDQFKKDLGVFIQGTLQHKYNGKSAPKLVLFSPIAEENLHDPNLPDGAANNQNLKLFTEAMADAAKENGVLFVDLFTPSLELYAKASKPLTVNGIHLTEAGDRLLAGIIVKALFPNQPELKLERVIQAFFPKRTGVNLDQAALEKIRAAVLDKNFYWFHRYRTVDGYNVYGGRSQLKYEEGVSNWDVFQREMEILEVITANRDRRIWALLHGKEVSVDDANTPAFIPVKSNKPGPLPDGSYPFLDPQEAISHMKTAPGMKVNLFASEKDFPELQKPVQMAWDTKGRLWVAVIPSYPHWKPKDELNDKVLIFEDTDGDGKADKCTVFADHLNIPTGLEFYRGGLLLAQAPYLMFVKDTDGDGKADYFERVLGGLDSADTHHTENSFTLDPGGALYFQEGVFHHTQVETLLGPIRNINAGVYRYEPRSQKFEVYTAYNFANPHGHVFDRWGEDVVMDGTGAVPYYGASFSGHTDYPQKHKGAPAIYKQRTRPCPGIEILSSRHFPEEMQGNLLVPNVIGFLGILNYKLADQGAGFAGKEVEPIVQSDDPNFRPADVKMGPDGAIYFLDWQNPIIGHMQHHLRDPSRDHAHGRIYRVTYPARPLLQPARIAGESVPHLLDLLKSPEDRTRYRAKIELGTRDTKEVLAALTKWISELDPKDPEYEHHLMETLWVHQYHNVVNEPLLTRMLHSSNPHARAAATRVLCYWRDRVQSPLALLKVQANDENPRVRLHAVRACSFFASPKMAQPAAEVALEALNHPMDPFLKYTLDETMSTLDKFLKPSL